MCLCYFTSLAYNPIPLATLLFWYTWLLHGCFRDINYPFNSFEEREDEYFPEETPSDTYASADETATETVEIDVDQLGRPLQKNEHTALTMGKCFFARCEPFCKKATKSQII